MIYKVTFKKDGIKDLSLFKEKDILITNIEDNVYSLALSNLMSFDFYPRIRDFKKEIRGYSFKRDIYNGYMNVKEHVKGNAILTTKEPFTFEKEISIDYSILEHISRNETFKTVSNELENAKIVFLVGRGIGNKETLDKVKALAKKYNAEIGCTRPVCMNNWESYDRFVGISGKSLNCDLCVTFGVSGSGPLMKGLENVKKIISINNDKNALIFNYSDYGIVKDINSFLEEIR